jgi:hypothetical protein
LQKRHLARRKDRNNDGPPSRGLPYAARQLQINNAIIARRLNLLAPRF